MDKLRVLRNYKIEVNPKTDRIGYCRSFAIIGHIVKPNMFRINRDLFKTRNYYNTELVIF